MSIWAAVSPWMAILSQGSGGVEVPVVYSNGSMNPSLLCTRDGDTAWISSESANRLGWTVRIEGDRAKIDAYSKKIEVRARSRSGRAQLDLGGAITQLGGYSAWHEDSYWVYSKVTAIEVESNRIHIFGTLPMVSKTAIVSDPPRIVIDLSNVKMGANLSTSITGSIRFAQSSDETLRVVVQTDKTPLGPNLMASASETTISWLGAVAVKTEPYKSGPSSLDPMLLTSPNGDKGDSVEPARANIPLRLGPPSLENDTPSEVVIAIRYMGEVLGSPQFQRDDSGAYVVDLPNASLLASQQVQVINGQNLRSASLTQTREGVRIRVEFNRVMAARIAGAAGEMIIRATPPRESLNGIKGVVVALDARRGGKDVGTQFEVDGVSLQESKLNSDVCDEIYACLLKEGAKPILVRSGDAPMTDVERTVFANTKKAAFLISVGCSTSYEKPTVQYHPTSTNGRLLAECIAACISGAELRADECWLLTKTTMPAIIVTFGNLQTRETQKRYASKENRLAFAQQIAKGLINYSKGVRPGA